MNSERTVGDTDEFELIAHLIRNSAMPPNVSVGPGDDAAVFLVNGSALTSVDMLVEDVHFRTRWSSGADIGRKAVAVSVADIEAMGAQPCVMVVALGLPASMPLSWAKEFATGLREEAEKASLTLIGGDLSTAEKITISVTVIGQTAGRSPVLRSGAQVGNAVAYRGRLGWAAAGLATLSRGFRSPRAVVNAQRTPDIPYGAGIQAAEAGATAMIDISDSLVDDLGSIAQASSVVIDLDTARFHIDDPVATVGAALNVDPLSYILGGGGDHALAACFPVGQVPDDWQVIGMVYPVEAERPAGVLVNGIPYDPDSI